MKVNKIYVIHSHSMIESLYTLFPLIITKHNHLLHFLNIDSVEALRAEGRCAILVRVFKGNKSYEGETQKKRELILNFRKRFDRVIILDDGAGSDSLHFEYMDLVDLYYKGKLLRERGNYLQPMYGRQLFTNYYHNEFGINDEKVKLREAPRDPQLIKKLRLSWNLGCGIYPIPNVNLVRLAKGATKFNFPKVLRPWYVYNYRKLISRISEPVNFKLRQHKIQARFGANSLPNTIGFQRKIFVERCRENANVITGSVKPKEYNSELKRIAGVLSPFGWGEVCFRDFEAVINGTLLIKPCMDHIETWPDIYKSSKTYLPVDWAGRDLIDMINTFSKDIFRFTGIVQNAKEVYRKSLLELDDKISEFLEEAADTKLYQ